MKPGRSWLFYSLIRVGLFAVVLAILLILQLEPWIAAVVAALIALCLSYIFFRKPREEVARSLYDARHKDAEAPQRATAKEGSDEANEDAIVNAGESAADSAAPEATSTLELKGDSGSETETEEKPG